MTDLDALREERLRRTLAAVAAAHPYYRAKFKALGIAAGDIRTLDDLQRLPPTPKQDYISDPEAFRLRAGRSAGGLRQRGARALGRRLHHRHDHRKAVAVLQHRARRLRDLGSGAALQRGGGADRDRSRRQSLSARRISDRRVPQRDPLHHDRRPAGGARADRRGAFRFQGAKLARRGVGHRRALPAHGAVGRAELRAALPRRGGAQGRRFFRSAPGADLGRAGACRAARRDQGVAGAHGRGGRG